MPTTAQIDRSQMVRIPMTMIKNAQLEGVEIAFELTHDGLLLKPAGKRPRAGWAEQIAKAQQNGGREAHNELLDMDLDIEGWEW
ncbi:hypothetical protein FACS1894103_0990 [Campylobacterota bacterium]|nr:hypothetical protein FACS1894103_0990 [Campylobacterota bacterium]